MKQLKEIRWIGSSYNDLIQFPTEARRCAGFQLSLVQAGLLPHDWKPFDGIGQGALEIRIRVHPGTYRIIYVAKFEEAVYVLHCFEKKTQTTSKHDKTLATERYRAIVGSRKGKS
ncbi:type II toxin-antitoxin system RelE/ParE family toxin [Bordetella genomosp. 4]|uniref:Cytoplasmic protein n=1 Tax=Bordetella genomosp. 4 TaxID=463044 RepID=A0A261U5Y1_9BORD|nr:type II toxin-antitoxin system RelE/ParE family toxin [Bordetella genomosp. 4]OZI48625.1 cytoplasmic protein [Bordetella genomosp. 4]OZI56650.1 cytoplasmic protein [Bordetella genomosp. 4]